ncbi:MAG: GIY-YIG nuclease family protein [Candidatus Omnitrophica bacterium]|nr:GIY-YIG nuclease family protein [Candidatus Omnitrophota bacterium]
MKTYYLYIMASQKRGTLYIGITNDLLKRVFEHKKDLVDGFTKRYCVHKLVYYEKTSDIMSAILREKRMKEWNRQWKIDLIEKEYPYWHDLYDTLAHCMDSRLRGNDMVNVKGLR